MKIWRTDEELLHQGCIQQVSIDKGRKLGIWGGISGQVPTEARIFDENLDGQTYCGVLNHELKRSIVKLPDKGKTIYQQDLTPWHTSKMVKAKMKKTKLKILDWPAKNPNLNPIEFVWSILDKKLITTSIYNKATLRKRQVEKWKSLGIDLHCSLVNSMPERLTKYLQAKGEHFN